MRKTRYLSIRVMAGLVLLLGACRFGTIGESRGDLTVNLSDSRARTAHPFASDELMNTDHYLVRLTDPLGGMQEPVEVALNGTYQAPNIMVGDWQIAADAMNADDQVLGRGLASALIETGKLTNVNLIIGPAGNGTVSLVLDTSTNTLLTAGHRYFAWQKRADLNAYTELPILDVAVGKEATAQLGAGTYSVLAQIIDAQDQVVWGVYDVFYVYDGLVSRREMSVLESEFSAPPESAPVLALADLSYEKVGIAWTTTSARTERFRIQRLMGGVWTDIDTVPQTFQAYTETGLSPATSCTYRVRSENSFGDGPWSAELTASTLALRTVTGVMLQSETWTADTVYRVIGNFLVPSGLTLKLKPGVKIKIDASMVIYIDGTLEAKGDAAAPIVFGYDSANWVGLQLRDACVDAVTLDGVYIQGSIVSHAIFQGSGATINVENCYPYFANLTCRTSGGMNIGVTGNESKKLFIRNSVFDANTGTGLNITNTGYNDIIIENCVFRNQISGIWINRNGNVTIRNCLMENNRDWGFGWWSNWDGMYYDNGNILLHNNEIRYNGNGVYIAAERGNKNGLIESNSIHDNSGVGIYFNPYDLDWMGPSSITIRDNIIMANNRPFEFYSAATGYTFIDNHIVDNRAAAYFNVSGQRFMTWTGNYFDNPLAAYEWELGPSQKGSWTALNLSNNAWWTNDQIAIKNRIFDYNIDILYATINVEPIVELTGYSVEARLPAEAAVLGTSVMSLVWRSLGRIESYTAQIATDAAFANVVWSRSSLKTRTVELGGNDVVGALANGGTYYWRVVGKDAGGAELASSAVRGFSLAIGTPAIIAPADGERWYESLKPQLEWSPVTGAAKYRLELSASAGFETSAIDIETSNTVFVPTADLSADSTYYWRVRAYDGNGIEGPVSAVASIVFPPPGLGVLIGESLPKNVEVAIDGPASFGVAGGEAVRIIANAEVENVEWYINGVYETNTGQLTWPARAKGNYVLSAVITCGGQWYSAFRGCEVRVVEETNP